jgi:hypothetical protein
MFRPNKFEIPQNIVKTEKSQKQTNKQNKQTNKKTNTVL